jgi:uncharacterized protein YjbI with pentapeptide repeats
MGCKVKSFFIVTTFLFLFSQSISSQERHSTTFAYGWAPESSRLESRVDSVLLTFRGPANFRGATFDSEAAFGGMTFCTSAFFSLVTFHSVASFGYTTFDSVAHFAGAEFDGLADFQGALFDNWASFENVKFHGQARFGAGFLKSLEERDLFSLVGMSVTTTFHSRVFFRGAMFDSLADFRWARFYGPVDFRWARFFSAAKSDFSFAEITNKIILGMKESDQIQRFDFTRTILLDSGKLRIEPDSARGLPARIIKYPGAKIVMYGPVDLKIQLERFKFLQLANHIDYYSKRDIISVLKDTSFSDQRFAKERFELDYIFAKSTMYQDQLPYYAQNKWYQIWKWPKWIGNFIYYITMGLGYRPLRLFWVLLFAFIVSTIGLYKWFSQPIDLYIRNKFRQGDFIEKLYLKSKRPRRPRRRTTFTHYDSFINSMYFSFKYLIGIRFSPDVLAQFEIKLKALLMFEWIIGKAVYIAFFLLSARAFFETGSLFYSLSTFKPF